MNQRARFATAPPLAASLTARHCVGFFLEADRGDDRAFIVSRASTRDDIGLVQAAAGTDMRQSDAIGWPGLGPTACSCRLGTMGLRRAVRSRRLSNTGRAS